jgi:RimJ/RimL family protein N-acetyltransferase
LTPTRFFCGASGWTCCLNWALRLRARGELVGHLQVGVLPDHADMAWLLGSKWQHRGYATEAAKAVLSWLRPHGVLEIRAAINPRHVASIRVAERLGFCRTTELSGTELIWKRTSASSS